MLSLLGSGEATISLMEWWKTGTTVYASQQAASATDMAPKPKSHTMTVPPFGPELTRPTIFAADPVSVWEIITG